MYKSSCQKEAPFLLGIHIWVLMACINTNDYSLHFFADRHWNLEAKKGVLSVIRRKHGIVKTNLSIKQIMLLTIGEIKVYSF